MNQTLPFSPWDMDVASANFGAMCGHGALAAAMGTDVVRVMQYFDGGGWVNVPTMGTALKRAGITATRVEGWPSPTYTGPAVTILQWTGRWMNEGVPAAARCEHRHWVAVREGLIWDCNAETWMPQEVWEKDLVPTLLPPKGDGGWFPYRSFVLLGIPRPSASLLTLSAWQKRALDLCGKGMALSANSRDMTRKQAAELEPLVQAGLLRFHPEDNCYRRPCGATP